MALFHIEDVQDQVELALMRSGEHDVARAYVLYRAKRMEERRAKEDQTNQAAPSIKVVADGGPCAGYQMNLRTMINAACVGLDKLVDAEAILRKP